MSKFYKVRCKECGNEQIVFGRASSKIHCQACSSLIAEPTGGNVKIFGDVIKELE
jgi:small subunit ribosomal protein S27e